MGGGIAAKAHVNITLDCFHNQNNPPNWDCPDLTTHLQVEVYKKYIQLMYEYTPPHFFILAVKQMLNMKSKKIFITKLN